jgi:hypothetical protein
MSVNRDFADIVHNSLGDVDEVGDDILLEAETLQPRMFKDQMPPLAFPFGYMIISSTFMFYDDEEQDGYEEF